LSVTDVNPYDINVYKILRAVASTPVLTVGFCLEDDDLVSLPDNFPTVRLASTGNLALIGLPVLDGVQVFPGDRILVKDQAAPAENGIYVAHPAGWIRAPDLFDSCQLNLTYNHVWVTEGTVNAGSGYVMTQDPGAVIDQDPITFEIFAEAGSSGGGGISFTADAGLDLTGTSLSVELDTDADADTAGVDGGSSGLEFDVTGATGQLRVRVSGAARIERTADGLAVKVDGSSVGFNAQGELQAASASIDLPRQVGDILFSRDGVVYEASLPTVTSSGFPVVTSDGRFVVT